jgi:integrase
MRRIDGAMTRHTIGHYPAISLAEARAAAIGLGVEIARTGKIGSSASTRFQGVFERWMKEDQATNRSAAEVRRSMGKDVLPRLGSSDLASLTRTQIEAIIEKILARGARVHANRVLAMLRRLFAWSEGKGLIASSPIAKMEMPTREISRERTLTKEELVRVWRASQGIAYPFGPFIQLLVVTGQRRSEVAVMEWSELDLGEGTWTQPASKTKNGRSHIVHLSPTAISILAAIPRNGVHVFSTNGKTPISGFSKAKKTVDKRSGVSDWTIHDLRRTFATYATETLGEAPAVVDKVLNHSSGAVRGVARVYMRAEYLQQRKDLMERWGSWVESISAG